MKIKVKIEGEVDIREIEDIFEGLDTTKIDV